ncbi:Bug family tripartite tricarboxylate transporter substrate binding protein, partial [Achromobacter sp.]
MTPTRFLASCTLAFSALLPAVSAQAAGYPDHPIRLIVPTSPGSTADVVARVVAENLGKALAQPLIVENLAGAAGIPGTRQLVAAKPDGYTLA